MSEHARLSPSAAHRWLRCPGSVMFEQDQPDRPSKYADEGTVAHWVAQQALSKLMPCDSFTGMTVTSEDIPQLQHEILVDQEMASYVQVYCDAVFNRLQSGSFLLVEQKIQFGHLVGVDDQFGTADAVIHCGRVLEIHDLKYGKGVQVFAEENEQLMVYALGKLDELELAGYEIDKVVIGIHQPRLDHLDLWETTPARLREFELTLRAAVAETLQPDADLVPGPIQCKWCRAKAICPAIGAEVSKVTAADFEDLAFSDEPPEPTTNLVDSELATKMACVDWIEDWCKAVRAEVETRLLANRDVPGFKLVQGKRGARAWSDADAAEALLKGKFRLKTDEIYEHKLISPTKAEKVLKDSPRRWAQVEPLITQTDGKPSVAPISDKRPAYSVADQFQDLTEGGAPCA